MAVHGENSDVIGEHWDQKKEVDFGTGLIHTGAQNVLVGRFSASDGSTSFVRSFGCSGNDHPGSITGSDGTTCFSGTFLESLDYGGSESLFGASFAPLICFVP
jgi:hypothetical protein